MSLMSALNAAVSGLRTTQAGMNLVSQNVANANSVGYTRRTMYPVQQLAGDRTSGVRTGEVERVLDVLLQKQLRLENAGAAYTGLRAAYAGQLDKLFGVPGEAGALDTVVNAFTQSLQTLLSEPGSTSARNAVLDQAGVLASQLHQLSDSVQTLRTDAEGRIGLAVERANELLTSIAEVNNRIVASQNSNDPGLLDERDRMINELSKLMDVQVSQQSNGGVSLSTTAGLTLLSGQVPIRLAFDGRVALAPEAEWTPDSATRGVGTIQAIGVNGVATDVIANRMIRSGEIAAALEMRDDTLVEAQRQLDELAAGLARALSDRPVTGTAASSAAGTGFQGDFTDLKPGNTITLDITVGGVPRKIALVGLNGNGPASIPPGAVGDPGATVITFNATGSMSSVAASIQAALTGAGIAVTTDSPSGNLLRFVATGGTAVTALGGAVTAFGPETGNPQIALFTDAGAAYTGAFDGRSQMTGFAQRITVNGAILNDRARLVVYGTGILPGDTTRPRFMLDALTKTARSFTPAAGLNGSAPFSSTVTGFARRVVEHQGAAAESAKRLDEGQAVALSSVESRFAEKSGVNIDQEMAQLVQLQTAYGANARVMTAVRDMMDLLMRM
ncbi:MAG TPA: flagellar hook-associated protein FlgK [Microvirga sp.]|jgi:flagellar hook-associated protein 1 FlgK